MSSLTGAKDEIARLLRGRLDTGLRRIAFFIVPSAMAFLALGDVIASALYRSGRFTHADAVWVWGTLAGSAVGLLASTMGRLYSSTFYALRDTRTPLRFAVARVLLTLTLGYLFALPLPRALGVDPRWGVAGLTASAGIAGWVEFALLRRALNARIGRTGLAASFVLRLWASAVVAAAAGVAVKYALDADHAIVLAAAALGLYGLIYFALTAALGVSEGATLVRRVAARVGPGRR
jgi:putative peptidoglycan lipid II flippase